MRWYANEGASIFNAALIDALPSLGRATSEPVRWISPRPPAYGELWNEAFVVGIGRPDLAGAFREFWPHSGNGTPHWDAVGLVELSGGGRGVVLIEAKAHRYEFDKPGDKSTAGHASLAIIKTRCVEARRFYGVDRSIPDWSSSYYQVANRYAHLWWLHQVQGIPTWLVWAFICDDPDWRSGGIPLDEDTWRALYGAVTGRVGIMPQHELADRVGAVYLDPAVPTLA